MRRFDRWMSLKSDMLRAGFIGSISQKITIDYLMKWRSNLKSKTNILDFEDLIFSLIEKIDQLNGCVMSK